MLYRAIGLVLDFIHRLVCGRQNIPLRTTSWVGPSLVRMTLEHGELVYMDSFLLIKNISK
jgi:hypothetical protein